MIIHGYLYVLSLIIPNVLGGYWSPWSPWSACSVSCDGGLSSQRRRCFGSRFRCQGPDVRYRICNITPCTGEITNRAARTCKQHNTKWTSGILTSWIPVSDQTYQCYVICKDESRNIPNEIRTNVEDGVKCGSGKNFFCAAGKCVRLGCDGFPWSNKVVDVCGVCGGEGTSCNAKQNGNSLSGNKPSERYGWKIHWGPCSVTCGTGFRQSRIVCQNLWTGKELSRTYRCHFSPRPDVMYKECSHKTCGPRWEVSTYSLCSAECDGGIQRRSVKCVTQTDRSRTINVNLYRCPDPIPVTERPCNLNFCPAYWETGPWSECTATCGLGTHVRAVYCVKQPLTNSKVNVSEAECMGARPQTVRACSNADCVKLGFSFEPKIILDNVTYYQTKRMKRVNIQVGTHATLLPRQPVKIRCVVKNFDKKMIFWTKNSRLISMSPHKRVYVNHNGVLKIKRADPDLDKGEYTCIAGLAKASVHLRFQNKKYASKAARTMMEHMPMKKTVNELLNKPQSDKVPGAYGTVDFNVDGGRTSEHSERKLFMVNDWTKCSKSCGVGVQTRKVTCSIVSEGYIKVVDTSECVNDKIYKPPSHRTCIIHNACPSWKTGIWSKCSADSCIRDGMALQKRPVYCVRNTTIINEKKCNSMKKPDQKQECSTEKCISRWKAMKWTGCRPRCSKRGKKSRIIACVWSKTGKSAGTNCRSKPRPVAWKRCQPKFCKTGCRDKSRYCSLIGLLHMCRYETFIMSCCKTCRPVNQINN